MTSGGRSYPFVEPGLRCLAAVAAAVTTACGGTGGTHGASLAAGAATVVDSTRDAFSLPSPNLTEEHRTAFFVGNSFFNQNWVSAPSSVETRDGLGPLFNARSCSGCHFKDGRSRPPEPGEPFSTALLRVSVPGRGPHGEPVPDPTYGDQIQGSALPGVAPEADVIADYDAVEGTFADGERYTLRRPRIRLEKLGYGPVAAHLSLSPRVAPAMIGLGLLEAVPEATLLAIADPGDRDRDGVSGRPNVVWDALHAKPALGRFGWKAEQPTVLQQTAGAFRGDMGITTAVFEDENHMPAQRAAASHPSGGYPEATSQVLESVVLYARTLAVPARRDVERADVRRGEALFESSRCTACHVATLQTGPMEHVPELDTQIVHAYTDLLLHDMGPGLADDRPAFEASGREWRTPPLWGGGLVSTVNAHSLFLHDGRARGFAEAILWHDGEAHAAREAFVHLTRAERAALVAFLGSI